MPEHIITIVAVCFERPKKLFRLWKSARKFHSDHYFLVVDNSREALDLPFLERDKKSRAVRCEDHGNLSAARNLALKHVTTPLFLLVDDDEWFTDDSLNLLVDDVAEGRGDIAAGVVSEGAWVGHLRLEHGGVRILPVEDSSKAQAVSACQNFYVGRTEDFRRIRAWDETLPVCGEHIDSLLKFRLAGLRIWHNPKVTIEHEPGGEGEDYDEHRFRLECTQKLLEKWRLNWVTFAGGYRTVRDARNPAQPVETTGFLVLGADRETGLLISWCLHHLGVCMWDRLGRRPDLAIAGLKLLRQSVPAESGTDEAAEHAQIRDQVHRLAVREKRIGVMYRDGDARAEFIAQAMRAAGVGEVKFIWCLCDESPDLEEFFRTQPSQDVLVIDPEYFRKHPLSVCEQFLEFCEIEDPEAIGRVRSKLDQAIPTS